MIRVAIFADIHGKFLLPFKLVDRYQKLTGRKVDLILQCGDMGAFPDKANMDKATLRHAKNDRDELGFIDDFVDSKIQIREFLDKLDIDMLCVRGNHEDHEFLDKLEQQAIANEHSAFAIDAYERVWVCRTGIPLYIYKSNSSNVGSIKVANFIEPTAKHKDLTNRDVLSIVGVGRIGDMKGRNHAPYIQHYEKQNLKKLVKAQHSFDMLITHDKASNSQRGYGSLEIAKLLDQVLFAYHFYGHTGEPYAQSIANNGLTTSVKIKELEFNNDSKLETGCMLIFEKIANLEVADTLNLDSHLVYKLNIVPLNDIIDFNKNTWHYM